MTAKLAEYCRLKLRMVAQFHHDMRRDEYGKQDGSEYAHFICDNCGAALTVRMSPKGYRSHNYTENTFQECRK
jgi:predicted RNA-binding Zn-ribbon protein involved in translation (DUF1610 family)